METDNSHFSEDSAGVQGEGVGCAGLDEYFSAYLRTRGVPPDVAVERGYAEVLSGKPVDGRFASSYGFPRKAAGLVIPLHGVLNHDAWQLRLDPAVQAAFTDAKGKPIRFLTPRGQKNVLATAPRTRHLLRESRQAVVVTEGVTRVDAIAAYDVPAIGMTGIWNCRSAGTTLPDWESILVKGQRFIIAPDGDARINGKVASAVRRLRLWLLGKGADTVHVLTLPDDLGLDDWIAQRDFADRGTLTHTLRELVSENPVLAPAGATKPGAENAPGHSVGSNGRAIYATLKGDEAGHRVVDEARRALVAAYGNADTPEDALYRREDSHGPIVRTHDERIHEVGKDELRELMLRSATWWSYSRSGEKVPDWPALAIVNAVHANTAALDLPVLKGTRPYPVLERTDYGYTLLGAPGYYPDSGWLIVGEHVPRMGIAEALQHLIGRGTGLISDFPFGDDDGKGEFVNGSNVVNALALSLSIITKPAMGQTPMFLLSKPQPETGASKLLETLHALATGQVLAFSTAADPHSDEWAKRIVSVIKRGDPHWALDNVNYLASDALAQVLTAPRFSERILGTNDMLNAEVRFIVSATGNNPTMPQDLISRTVPIRLNRQDAEPAQWRPKGGWAVNNPEVAARLEIRYRAAIITLVRHWIDVGCPLARESTRYHKWAAIVGGILEAAGLDGLAANVADFRGQANDTQGSFVTFVGWWWEKIGEQLVGVNELAAPMWAEERGAPAALETWFETTAQSRRGFNNALGQALRKLKDYTVGVESGENVRIDVGGRKKQAAYALRRVS